MGKDERVILGFNFEMEDGLLKYGRGELLVKVDEKGRED